MQTCGGTWIAAGSGEADQEPTLGKTRDGAPKTLNTSCAGLADSRKKGIIITGSPMRPSVS